MSAGRRVADEWHRWLNVPAPEAMRAELATRIDAAIFRATEAVSRAAVEEMRAVRAELAELRAKGPG